MGISNNIVLPFYKEHMKNIKGDVALLGWADNTLFEGDLYDKSLGNWEINSEWKLSKKYDTIICTRCAYFAKNVSDLINRCKDSLNDSGQLYIDWGLGDHWRFPDFKVGWRKNGEHEYAYGRLNLLWSMIWHDDFLKNDQVILFEEEIKKHGYASLKDSIYEEVPSVFNVHYIEECFDKVEYNFLTIVKPLQLYVLVSGMKHD